MYEARDEAALEKIRQMVRQGKDPESIGNYDGQIRDYQDRSGNIYAIRDEVAREKIRMLVQQGQDLDGFGNYDRDIRDYQDRCNEQNQRSQSFSKTYTADQQKISNTQDALLSKAQLGLKFTDIEQAWQNNIYQRFKLMDKSITDAYLARTAPTVDFNTSSINDEVFKQTIKESEKSLPINYYQVLNLKPEWDGDKLKKVLLKTLAESMGRLNDARGDKKKQLEQRIEWIREARKILIHPESKERYDRGL
jgi:hypothetical protein